MRSGCGVVKILAEVNLSWLASIMEITAMRGLGVPV
jgi:hypothetical protein